MSSVWVVINADKANERLINLIDEGYLAEATGLSHTLEVLIEKLKSHVQQFGGYMPLAVCGRVVMNIPISAAEQLPNIMEGFNSELGKKAAVGIGMTFSEACKACQKSISSNEIELYGAEDDDASEDYLYRSDTPYPDLTSRARRAEGSIILPPNVFDSNTPDDAEYKEDKQLDVDKPVMRGTIEEEMQSDTQYIQMLAQQMGGGAMQPQQPQGQPAQGQKAPTRSLLDALNGGSAQQPQLTETKTNLENQRKTPEKPQSPEAARSSEQEEEAKQLAGEVSEAEEEAGGEGSNDKLAVALHQIKQQIPQIMALADKNPAAFKQTMGLVQKLVSAAKSRQQSTHKSELREQAEELEKGIADRLRSLQGTKGVKLPIGTRKGKFKRVLVNGKAVWRELSAGQVLGQDGNPLSVLESNKQAQASQNEKK